jgi:hypothetical protein
LWFVSKNRNGKQRWESSGERHLSRSEGTGISTSSPVKEFSVKDMERSGFGEKESVPGDRVENKRRFSDWDHRPWLFQSNISLDNWATMDDMMVRWKEDLFLFPKSLSIEEVASVDGMTTRSLPFSSGVELSSIRAHLRSWFDNWNTVSSIEVLSGSIELQGTDDMAPDDIVPIC